jgi:hypothetical protein
LYGREVVVDEPRSGRTCTSKTEENMTKVRVFVRSDRRLTVRMIDNYLNLNLQTVHDFLTEEIDMRTLGFCIRTMCYFTLPHPWKKFDQTFMVFQWFRSLNTSLIWVRVTSSFSWNSNYTSKFVILELWITSKRSWQTCWGYLHIKISSAVIVSGNNVSGGVWHPKGDYLVGDDVNVYLSC